MSLLKSDEISSVAIPFICCLNAPIPPVPHVGAWASFLQDSQHQLIVSWGHRRFNNSCPHDGPFPD